MTETPGQLQAEAKAQRKKMVSTVGRMKKVNTKFNATYEQFLASRAARGTRSLLSPSPSNRRSCCCVSVCLSCFV
jgi:hypothetical protein